MIGTVPTEFNLFGLAAVGLRVIECQLDRLEHPNSAELSQLALCAPMGAVLIALMGELATPETLESLRVHLDEMLAEAAETAARGRSIDDLLMPAAGHA